MLNGGVQRDVGPLGRSPKRQVGKVVGRGCREAPGCGCWDLHRVSFSGCRAGREKVLPCPAGLHGWCWVSVREDQEAGSVGTAPGSGMGAKGWKTPQRNTKPASWTMPPSECRERAGRKNYTHPDCFTSCRSASFCQPPGPGVSRRPANSYQQAINKTAGATGVNILALFGSSCLPLK